MKATLPTVLLVALITLAACTSRTPEEAVESAVAEAQAGRLEAFLDHFEPDSRKRLALFWSVSQQYGYVEEKTLSSMGSLTVESVAVDGDRATVAVQANGRSGTLALKQVDGEWLIELPLTVEESP